MRDKCSIWEKCFTSWNFHPVYPNGSQVLPKKLLRPHCKSTKVTAVLIFVSGIVCWVNVNRNYQLLLVKRSTTYGKWPQSIHLVGRFMVWSSHNNWLFTIDILAISASQTVFFVAYSYPLNIPCLINHSDLEQWLFQDTVPDTCCTGIHSRTWFEWFFWPPITQKPPRNSLVHLLVHLKGSWTAIGSSCETYLMLWCVGLTTSWWSLSWVFWLSLFL